MVFIRGTFGSFFTASPLSPKLVLCIGLVGELLCPVGRRLRDIAPPHCRGKGCVTSWWHLEPKCLRYQPRPFFFAPEFSKHFSSIGLAFVMTGFFFNLFAGKTLLKWYGLRGSLSPYGLLHCVAARSFHHPGAAELECDEHAAASDLGADHYVFVLSGHVVDQLLFGWASCSRRSSAACPMVPFPSKRDTMTRRFSHLPSGLLGLLLRSSPW